ncbi:hypothetical protein [Deinococcus misasensis]|uniref:hypothetical protein n=1 Tax=Deinococcus misasensis TaxID=392413 RepID=UPI0005528B1C|nr:hypothetical protein [Deinococcus misasensis]
MSENKTSYYEVLTAGNYESTYRIRGEVISTADYSSEFLEWHANRGGLKRLPATDTQVLEDRIAELEAQVASFKGVVDELGALKQEFRDFVSQFIFEDAPEGTPEPAPL